MATRESATPPGPRTLIDVLADLRARGFRTDFQILQPDRVRCLACRALHAPEAVPLLALDRLEGDSDPADMIAVVALECPACTARGTAVLMFGPLAPPEHCEVLRRLRDARAAG